MAQPRRCLERESELLFGSLGTILMVEIVHERTDIKQLRHVGSATLGLCKSTEVINHLC